MRTETLRWTCAGRGRVNRRSSADNCEGRFSLRWIKSAGAAIGSGRLSLSADKRETGALPPDAEDAGESGGLFRSVSLIQNGADSAQQGFSRKGLLQKLQPGIQDALLSHELVGVTRHVKQFDTGT